MAGRPKITPEQAEAIKRLANGGMKAGPIAAMMDCPQRIVEDIVAGRTWRSGLQNCTDCQKRLKHDNRSGFCRACLLTRCAHCQKKLPEGRGNRRCKECKAAEREARLERQDRLCSRCEQPLFERRDHWCSACRRAYNEGRKLGVEKKPDGRKQRPMTELCQVCRQPSSAQVCHSCRRLVNTWGAPRVKADMKRIE